MLHVKEQRPTTITKEAKLLKHFLHEAFLCLAYKKLDGDWTHLIDNTKIPKLMGATGPINTEQKM
jgi:hypothetical protein